MYPLFFGALLGLIGNIFVRVGSVILDVVRRIMPIVERVFNVVKAALVTVGQNAGRFFRWISTGVRGLYDHVVKPIVETLRDWYARFSAFLRRVFDPLIRLFDRIQRILLDVWTKVLAPILEWLDKLRLAFDLLAKLGVPWAEKISDIIQAVQREIFERFREVQSWVNRATFWLDLLLDPRGWIKATPFLYTVWRFGGNIVNVITKLADQDGITRARNEDFRARNVSTHLESTVERFKSGEIRQSMAVQSAAARFRSRQSGRAS